MEKQTTLMFNDEALRFLYSSPMFQQLDEQQQYTFMQQFQYDEEMHAMLDVAADIQRSMLEIEAIVPSILPHPAMTAQLITYHDHLKAHTAQEDNVLYVPFGMKSKSPFVVLLQLSSSMHDSLLYMKGLLLPLFNLCAKQHRDLIIIPFSEQVEVPLVYQQGILNVEAFNEIKGWQAQGEAHIVPALEYALQLFTQDKVAQQRELFIMTNNDLTDYDAMQRLQLEAQLQQLQVDVSIVATNEQQFDAKPFTSAQKVYFMDEQF